jgi:hypothetical protein
MKAASHNIEALQMQIVRLIAGIEDKAFLEGMREALIARFARTEVQEAEEAAEVSELEMTGIRKSIQQIESGKYRSSEEVMAKMKAKLKH